MSYDSARVGLLTVLNGAARSNIWIVHETLADVGGGSVVIYGPASLNTGVYVLNVAYEDPTPAASIVWQPLKDAGGTAVAPPAINEARVYLGYLFAGAILFSIAATTPNNADTSFKVSKSYGTFGKSF